MVSRAPRPKRRFTESTARIRPETRPSDGGVNRSHGTARSTPDRPAMMSITLDGAPGRSQDKPATKRARAGMDLEPVFLMTAARWFSTVR